MKYCIREGKAPWDLKLQAAALFICIIQQQASIKEIVSFVKNCSKTI
jgi:hypothetical protein